MELNISARSTVYRSIALYQINGSQWEPVVDAMIVTASTLVTVLVWGTKVYALSNPPSAQHNVFAGRGH